MSDCSKNIQEGRGGWKYLSFYHLTLVFMDDLSVMFSCLWLSLSAGDRESSLALPSTRDNQPR